MWPLGSATPRGLSAAYPNGDADALSGTGLFATVSLLPKLPVAGLYQRAPMFTCPVTGLVYCDWKPSDPVSVPPVARAAPHGPNALDPVRAMPAAVNWPVRSVWRSVRSSTPPPGPPAAVPARVPSGVQV